MYLFNKEEKSKEDIEVAEKIVDLLDGDKVYNTLKKEIEQIEEKMYLYNNFSSIFLQSSVY